MMSLWLFLNLLQGDPVPCERCAGNGNGFVTVSIFLGFYLFIKK